MSFGAKVRAENYSVRNYSAGQIGCPPRLPVTPMRSLSALPCAFAGTLVLLVGGFDSRAGYPWLHRQETPREDSR